MADNTLNNIRLSLKYDTLANWNTSSLVLNAGEVGATLECTPVNRVGRTLKFYRGETCAILECLITNTSYSTR